jgi:hypothetical protein
MKYYEIPKDTLTYFYVFPFLDRVSHLFENKYPDKMRKKTDKNPENEEH